MLLQRTLPHTLEANADRITISEFDTLGCDGVVILYQAIQVSSNSMVHNVIKCDNY